MASSKSGGQLQHNRLVSELFRNHARINSKSKKAVTVAYFVQNLGFTLVRKALSMQG
jgi:hypothetical protein